MKKYQIAKVHIDGKSFYIITTKEAIEDFFKTHFLPYDCRIKNKKTLLFLIENNENFIKYKGNTSYKTIFVC